MASSQAKHEETVETYSTPYTESARTSSSSYHALPDESVDFLMLYPGVSIYNSTQPTWNNIAVDGHMEGDVVPGSWAPSFVQNPSPSMLTDTQQRNAPLPAVCGPSDNASFCDQHTAASGVFDPGSWKNADTFNKKPSALPVAGHRQNGSGPGQSAIDGSTIPETESLICSVCSQEFTGAYAKGNMCRHRRHKHKQDGGESVLSCSWCTRTFKRNDARLKHQRKAHPELNLNPPVRRDQRGIR